MQWMKKEKHSISQIRFSQDQFRILMKHNTIFSLSIILVIFFLIFIVRIKINRWVTGLKMENVIFHKKTLVTRLVTTWFVTAAMMQNLTGVTSFSLISPWWHLTVNKGGSSPFSLRLENVFYYLFLRKNLFNKYRGLWSFSHVDQPQCSSIGEALLTVFHQCHLKGWNTLRE